MSSTGGMYEELSSVRTSTKMEQRVQVRQQIVEEQPQIVLQPITMSSLHRARLAGVATFEDPKPRYKQPKASPRRIHQVNGGSAVHDEDYHKLGFRNIDRNQYQNDNEEKIVVAEIHDQTQVQEVVEDEEVAGKKEVEQTKEGAEGEQEEIESITQTVHSITLLSSTDNAPKPAPTLNEPTILIPPALPTDAEELVMVVNENHCSHQQSSSDDIISPIHMMINDMDVMNKRILNGESGEAESENPHVVVKMRRTTEEETAEESVDSEDDINDEQYYQSTSFEQQQEQAVNKQYYHAQRFHKSGRHHKKIAFRLMAENYEMLAKLPFPTTVLDIGCKTGDMTRIATFLPTVTTIYGIDSAADMIKVAKEVNGDSRVTYEVCNVSDPNTAHFLPANHYALITLFDADALLRSPIQTLLTAFNVLRPGGYLIGYAAAEPDDKWESIVYTLSRIPKWSGLATKLENVKESHRREGAWSHHAQPEQLIGRILEEVGFDIIDCTLEDDTIILTPEETKDGLMMEKGLSNNVTSDSELAEVANECQTTLNRQYGRLSEKFLYKTQMIVMFVAQKTPY